MKKRGDVLLIVVVATLLALAVVPTEWFWKHDGDETLSPQASNDIPIADQRKLGGSRAVSDRMEKTLDAVENHRAELEEVIDIAKSAGRNAGYNEPQRLVSVESDIPRGDVPLMSLSAGDVWRFQVFGDEKLAVADTWTQKLIRAPSDDHQGSVETRFGDSVTVSAIHLLNGALRLDEFPFVVPMELSDVRTLSVEGELLPPPIRMVEGAVWNDIRRLALVYSFRDDKGRNHATEASAVIRNRAHVKGFESLVVPAGRFGGYRIEWITRIDIKADGRPVLAHLTTEPYRRETMWVSPGIGIVKREIDYLRGGRKYRSVTLSLDRHVPASGR
jgi:hypothetical protein